MSKTLWSAMAKTDIWELLRTRDSSGLSVLIASAGSVVNEVGAGEQTPLHLACELDAKDCVSVLLAAKAGTETEDGQLRTPLSLACESRAFGSAQLLLAGDASLAARDKNDMTPLHWMAYHGQSTGAPQLLQLAIAKGADVNAVNYQMQSALHCAIARGNVQSALLLIEAGARLSVEDETGSTVVHLAMQHAVGVPEDESGSFELLGRLLAAPGGKEAVNAPDREKRTPLHWAAGKNAERCVGALIEAGANVNAADWAEHTPLQWAASVDSLEAVKALVAAGARVDKFDHDKRTSLHWAAHRGADRVLKFLLDETDSAVDATDYGGFAATHSAARRGAVSVLKLLLAKGADPNLAALNGETPTDLAFDLETKRALAPVEGDGKPSLKRRRSLSTDQANLEGELPALVEALYATVKKGDLAAVRTLCVDSVARKVAGQASGALSGALEVGAMSTSTRTQTVHVDLTLSAGGATTKALHRLVFGDDGLISASDLFLGCNE